jgi:hypothetical protein
MHPDDVSDAFAYIQAVQARDVDTACTVVKELGPELRRLLLDVAERVIVPVTALDDQDEELHADSFALEALGRIFLEVLRDGNALCPAVDTAIARILTEDHQYVADVLRQLETVGVGQALDAHPAPAGAHPVCLTIV